MNYAMMRVKWIFESPKVFQLLSTKWNLPPYEISDIRAISIQLYVNTSILYGNDHHNTGPLSGIRGNQRICLSHTDTSLVLIGDMNNPNVTTFTFPIGGFQGPFQTIKDENFTLHEGATTCYQAPIQYVQLNNFLQNGDLSFITIFYSRKLDNVNYLKTVGGAKKCVHVGPRGGKYTIKKGRKCYIAF